MNPQTILTRALLAAALLLVAYRPADVLLQDGPGVLIDPTENVTTSEDGSTAQLSVVLTEQPAESVTISVQSTNTAEGTVDPAELIFPPELWDEPQIVTVTGQPDDVDDGDIEYYVQFTVSSADPLYDGLIVPDVPVINEDIDTAGVLVDPETGLTTNENGGSDQFSVALLSRPTHAVTIQVTNLSPDEVDVSPPSVTIQPENWTQAAVFTVTGQPDQTADGDQPFTLTLDVESDDPKYAALTLPDVTGTNLDVDSAGVIVTPTSGLETTEAGGTDTFSVTLTSRPAAVVTINAASSAPTEATVSPPSIEIEPDDWDQPHVFTVAGVADDAADGDAPFSISLSITSSDPNYNNLTLPTVTGVNRNVDIKAVDDSYSVAEDTLLTVAPPGILANDAGPGGLSVVLPLEAEPAEGDLTVQANGSFQYDPPEDFHGEVSFQYRVTNGTDTSDPATVTITVTPVNDAPVAAPDNYLTNGSLTVPAGNGVLANDSDVEGAELTAELHTDPVEGSVNLKSDGSFTFTAAAGFEGQATFTYRACDDEDACSDPATVTITVDRTPPALPVWTSPVGTEGTFETTGEIVTLRVTASADTARVRFNRWDHVVEDYFEIANITVSPYQVTLDAGTLPLGQNQIFATSYDAAGNASNRQRIIIHLQRKIEPVAYLPVVLR